MCYYTKKSQGWIKSAPTPTKLTELSHCSPSPSLRPGPMYTDDLFGFNVHGKGKRNRLSVYKHVVYCSVHLGDTVQTNAPQRPSQSTQRGYSRTDTRELKKYTDTYLGSN